MTDRNTRGIVHRPNTVCRCEEHAIYDGIDRCIKCGKLWPSAYGKSAGLSEHIGSKLLLHAIAKHGTKRRR